MPEPPDDFDRSLRDRIGAAEARVRVSSGPPDDRAAASGVARWLRPALVLATAAVAVVLAVLVIGQLPNRTAGDATPSPSAGEGVSASARNGDFVLTLFSPRSTWTTEDAIEIIATLSYDGDEQEVEIGGGGGPVVFSLVQLEGGDAVLGGGQDLPCLRYPLGPDEPLVWPFEKAGGINDEPPFDRAFFEDPDLHLPAGRWEVHVVLEYGIEECGDPESLEVSIQLDVLEAEGSPGPSAVATEPPVSSGPPSPLPSSLPTTDLNWTVAGAFPGTGPSMVTQVIAWGSRLVAVGVAYEQHLPTVGPEPPHTARVWLSADGRRWDVVDLGVQFRNANLGRVIVRADGSLLALGHRFVEESDGQLGVPEAAAWESVDGRAWTPTTHPLPTVPGDVVQGDQGYLASLPSSARSGRGDALWHSSDGHTWNQVLSLGADEYIWAMGAGPEGFVVSGRGTGESGFIWASGDGRDWLPAPSLPSGVMMELTAAGADWVAVRGFEPEIVGETWFSPNGLDWSPLGSIEVNEVDAGDGLSCRNFPHYLTQSGSWLVMGATLGYGCSEGGFVVHGTPQISLDGATWTLLPFEEGTPGQTRSGSAVNASVVLGGNLILAGEHNGVATFWIGEPR